MLHAGPSLPVRVQVIGCWPKLMANPEHLKLIKQGVSLWNAMHLSEMAIVEMGGRVELESADLSGANLSGVNLRARPSHHRASGTGRYRLACCRFRRRAVKLIQPSFRTQPG